MQLFVATLAPFINFGIYELPVGTLRAFTSMCCLNGIHFICDQCALFLSVLDDLRYIIVELFPFFLLFSFIFFSLILKDNIWGIFCIKFIDLLFLLLILKRIVHLILIWISFRQLTPQLWGLLGHEQLISLTFRSYIWVCKLFCHLLTLIGFRFDYRWRIIIIDDCSNIVFASFVV